MSEKKHGRLNGSPERYTGKIEKLVTEAKLSEAKGEAAALMKTFFTTTTLQPAGGKGKGGGSTGGSSKGARKPSDMLGAVRLVGGGGKRSGSRGRSRSSGRWRKRQEEGEASGG